MPSDDDIARAFHEAYERLAPSFGYSTRTSSAKPWSMVPANNQALMVATVREVRALLGAADPTPKSGDRVQDGGQWGTLIRCPQCDGDGLLHQLDPDELARMATTRPSSAFEVDSLPVAGPSCGATLGDRCLIKGHPEECEPRSHCSCGRALPCRHCTQETT